MAEVATIAVKDATGTSREVPTILSLEEKIDTLQISMDAQGLQLADLVTSLDDVTTQLISVAASTLGTQTELQTINADTDPGAVVIVPSADAFETVAASQTAQVLGATGALGDFIAGVLVIPATTSPGNVLLIDNATSITVFAGGATSVSNLVPFFIPLGLTSVSGAWKITTGANVSCIGIGTFT